MLWHKAIGAGGVGGGGIELVGWQYLATWENASSGTDSFGTWTNGSYSSLEPGDIVIVISQISTSLIDRNFTVTGYTEVSDLFASGDANSNLAVHYKIMGNPVDTSVSWNTEVAGATVSAIAFRGVDNSTPLDVSKVDGTGTATSTVTFNSITPSTSGAWILAIGKSSVEDILGVMNDSSFTVQLTSGEFDGSYAQWSGNIDGSSPTGNFTTSEEWDPHGSTRVAWKTDWVSGSFTPTAWTNPANNLATASYVFCLLALRPA